MQLSLGASSTIAIDATGQVFTWGDNYYGQLGLGNRGAGTERTTPMPVLALPDARLAVMGHGIAAAVTRDGWLWRWGSQQPNLPTRAPLAQDQWLALSVGDFHGCGIQSNHSLWCWGTNDHGQLGIGTITAIDEPPQQVGVDTDWATINVGQDFTCATKLDLRLYCWGNNTYSELGAGAIGP